VSRIRPEDRRPAGPSALARQLHHVGSRELEIRIAAGTDLTGDLLKVSGGPSVPLPPHVVAAAHRAILEPGSRPSRGLLALRSAIAARIVREWDGTGVDPEREILVTNGAMEALNIVFRSLFEPGDRVVLPSPTFFFDGPLRLAGAEPVYVPGSAAEDWTWQIDDIGRAIDSRTQAILICNPTNPTGVLPSREDLAAILRLAEEHDLIVISDESYDRFAYDGRAFVSAGSLAPDRGRVVVVNSLSKSHALATWRMGYVVASAGLVDTFTRLLEWEHLHGPYVAQCVAAAALDGPQDWILTEIARYERSRDIVSDAVAHSPLLEARTPRAGPFLFVDVSRFDSPRTPADIALLRAGIPTVRGEYFGQPGYVRLPFGADDATIQRLAERLRGFDPRAAPTS